MTVLNDKEIRRNETQFLWCETEIVLPKHFEVKGLK